MQLTVAEDLGKLESVRRLCWYRPNPVYKIMVDQFVNVPFPAWYYPYLRDNAPAEHWNEAGMQLQANYTVDATS